MEGLKYPEIAPRPPPMKMLSFPEKVAQFYLAVSQSEPSFHTLIKKLKEAKQDDFAALRGDALQLLYMTGTNFRQLIKVCHSEYGFEDNLRLRRWDYRLQLEEKNFEIYSRAKDIRKEAEAITQGSLEYYEKVVKEVYKRIQVRDVFWEALGVVLKDLQTTAVSVLKVSRRYLQFLSEQKLEIDQGEAKRIQPLLKRIDIDFVDVFKEPKEKRKPDPMPRENAKSKGRKKGKKQPPRSD
jgi:hypothetical protein